MKIIGTGLSGLVGSRIVELLQDRHEFVDFSLDSGVDITDFPALQSAFTKHQDAESVLHLAAFTDVSAAHEQTNNKDGLCYRINVQGTKNVARLCAQTGKYLIHVSTDFVFDGKKETPYTEEDQPHPIEWYGQTKLWAEEKVKDSNGEYAILRTAFPFKAKPAAPNLEPKIKLDLVRKIKGQLEAGEKLSLFTDQIITPTFIDDLVKVVGVVLIKKPQGIYHAVGSTSLCPYALGKEIAKVFRLNAKLIRQETLGDFLSGPSRPRQKNLSLANDKLHRELGVTLSDISEALLKIKGQLEG